MALGNEPNVSRSPTEARQGRTPSAKRWPGLRWVQRMVEQPFIEFSSLHLPPQARLTRRGGHEPTHECALYPRARDILPGEE